MTQTPRITRLLRVYGRVQGVGFRHAMCSEAKSLGITGWVRNRLDGTVEALVQGDAAQVESLLAWARHGPRGAHVSRLEVMESNDAGQWNDFRQHPTQ